MVLSLCTGELADHRRWPSELLAPLRVPYDQPLASRRFMFRREVKSPPSTPLAKSNSIAPESVTGGAAWLTRMLDCTAPFWSIRNTRGFLRAATVGKATT